MRQLTGFGAGPGNFKLVLWQRKRKKKECAIVIKPTTQPRNRFHSLPYFLLPFFPTDCNASEFKKERRKNIPKSIFRFFLCIVQNGVKRAAAVQEVAEAAALADLLEQLPLSAIEKVGPRNKQMFVSAKEG